VRLLLPEDPDDDAVGGRRPPGGSTRTTDALIALEIKSPNNARSAGAFMMANDQS
jgi:hypothetical protein